VDTSWGDKAGLDRPRRPIRPGRRAWNRRLLQPPVRRETASARSACVIGRSTQLPDFSETTSKPYRRIGRW